MRSFSKLLSAVWIWCFSVSGTVSADEHPSQDHQAASVNDAAARSIDELKSQLEKILQDSHTPGLSVAIVHRDGPEWVAGLGLADVASHRVADAKTLFRIGSVSKGFVSLAILKLVNEGKLSLHDPVHELAPEVWFDNPWEATDPVRVVDLVEHTTGWDDMHLREYAKDASPTMTLREALDYDHHSRTSRWKPGTRMAYCNSGPAVAAYIVEKLSGQRFEDFVKQNFFDPIGMKTATYFQPQAQSAATLYQADSNTAFPYWNILFRPAGAINASAEDMAKYLQFYLNRGVVDGNEVLPASSIDRMEVPTRDWAAQAGLKTGYGLSNYVSISDGFVYHGHDGGVQGGITEMHYLKEYDVGYFFSVNSNSSAIGRIDKAIRTYITRNLAKPTPLPAVALSPAANQYTGWYQADSPRVQMTNFIQLLLGNLRLRFANGKMYSLTATLPIKEYELVPVSANQFRLLPQPDQHEAPAPIATDILLPRNDAGLFIQGYSGSVTLKHIPAWLVYARISLLIWFGLAFISVVLYAPFWLIAGMIKKRRRPAERWLRLWPLIAVLSLAATLAIVAISGDDAITRLGELTLWSAGVFISSLLFGIAAVAGFITWWRGEKTRIRPVVYWYSLAVILPILTAAIYLARWGIVGLRTWA